MTGSQTPPAAAAGLGAIVLAGGRGSRLGTDKAQVRVGGRRLVDRAVTAAAAHGAAPIVVVGPPESVPAGCRGVREEPPFAGPLAAVAAGLVAAPLPEWVLLLSCDLADPDAVCRLLGTAFAQTGAPDDGLVLCDPGGRDQWLAGRYRTAALRRRLACLPGPLTGLPLRRLFDGAEVVPVPATAAVTEDIDTAADLDRARRRPPSD